MADISRETIGTLHDKIKIKLGQTDYMPLFEKDLKNYRKNANLPGFRKGMVPTGMIKKMVGKSLFADAVVRSAEDNLRNYLVEEKVDIFGQPIFMNNNEDMPKLDLNKPEDYEFSFEIGLRPELKEEVAKDISATLYKVKVKPEDIDQRIDGFQSQFGELKDAEKIEGPESIVYVLFDEIDESGKKVENGLSKDTSLYVKIFTDDFQGQLKDKKKDDTVEGVLSKIVDPEKYPGVYQNLNLDAKNSEETGKHVRLTITSVKTLDKAPLNEDLYKKAFPGKEIKTEEEFKKAVEEDEQNYWNQAASNFMEHNLFHTLVESPMTMPKDFLKKLMSQTAEKPMTSDEVDKGYASFEEQLKWSLITDKIIKDQKLVVNPDELKEDVKEEIKQYFGSSNINMAGENDWIDNYVDQILADKQQLEQRVDKLMGRKVFDWLKTQVKPEEKEISQEDFKKILEEHNHHH